MGSVDIVQCVCEFVSCVGAAEASTGQCVLVRSFKFLIKFLITQQGTARSLS